MHPRRMIVLYFGVQEHSEEKQGCHGWKPAAAVRSVCCLILIYGGGETKEWVYPTILS